MPDPYDNTEDIFLPQRERLQILSAEEYELLWGLPRFSHADRDLFFTLNRREEEMLARLRTTRTKLHFLLQLGYFRVRQRFFFALMSIPCGTISPICRGAISMAR